MNGYSKLIDVAGVEHPLYFGRQAAEEFGLRTEKYLSDNGFKIAVDMVFAGMANHMTKNELPVLSYTEVYDMVEKLEEEGKFQEQYKTIAEVFWDSKHGRDYHQRLEEVKKKVEQEIEEMNEKLKANPNTGKD